MYCYSIDFKEEVEEGKLRTFQVGDAEAAYQSTWEKETSPRELQSQVLARHQLPVRHKEERLDCVHGLMGKEWYHE